MGNSFSTKIAIRQAGLRLFLCTLFLGTWTLHATAEETFQDWTWGASVDTEVSDSEFVRLQLTPEIVDHSQSSLNDLRVRTLDGAAVPHVVHHETRRSSVHWNSVTLTNKTYQEGDFARVTLDFKKRVDKDRVKVELSRDNYRRYAILEGSEDGRDWATVDTEWLFRIEHDNDVFKTDTFRFPRNDFQYLRLTVFNMEDEAGRVGVHRVEHAVRRAGVRPRIDVPINVTYVEPEEWEEAQTIIDIDLGFNNLPLDSITLDPKDDYFHRRYSLSERHAATEAIRRETETGWKETERDVPWTRVQQGVLYRIQRENGATEDLSLEGSHTSKRFLRLRIFHGDDAALDIPAASIDVTRYDLATVVFRADVGGKYQLLYGNSKAKSPSYDLAKAVDDVGDGDLGKASLGLSTRLVHADAIPPWSEQYAWLIWLVLLAAVAIMFAMIARNMANLKPEG